MGKREMQRRVHPFRLAFLCLAFSLLGVSPALAADHPYEFDPVLSLTGGCGTSKADPIPDPGCPERKPPKSFTEPSSVAVDSFGDEYVASFGAEGGKQGRIDIFSPKGLYIGEVEDEGGPKSIAIDSKGTLYTFDDGSGIPTTLARYKPIVYKPEEEEIEYGPREVIATDSIVFQGSVAVDESDHLFVDWETSIKEYSSVSEGNKLENTITNARLYFSAFVALDKQRRRLYASSCPEENIDECWVLVFNADKPNELLEEIKGPNPSEQGFASSKGWISIAVDEETGDFFVGDLDQSHDVYQFDESYKPVATLKVTNLELLDEKSFQPLQIAVSNAKGAFNHAYLFVPSRKDRALAFHPPVEFEPGIFSVSANGISEEEAELQALIEPDGGITAYAFEYLSQEEWEEAGESFIGAKVVGEGTILPTEREAQVFALVSGLEPGTEYRFLVSAENAAGQATPKEGSFTTYSDAPLSNACENQELRNARSTLLPDCRAYELVTPPDTNGQLPSGAVFAGDSFPTLKASPDGDAATFMTHGGAIPGFGGTGSYNGSLYRTERTKEGWVTESAGPTGAETTAADEGSNSPDQGYSFWAANGQGSAVIEGETTRYVRYPDGHSALVGRGEVEGEERTDPRARGKLITENGTHIIFQTRTFNGIQPVQLQEDAPPTGTEAVYDRTADEVTHVVSLLPGDETPKAGENAAYIGAAADGEGIAFTVAGKLYLRVNNAETLELGEGLTFAGVSEEGKRIFYLKGGNLVAFDTEAEKEIPFTNTGNAVPVNVSADGTRAYFVSTTAIGEAGPNPNGAFAKKGQQNLYLSEEGTIRFVGTVTERDVKGTKNKNGVQVDGLGLWPAAVEGAPVLDPSRITPDGSVLLFSSRANLDGYAHENVPELYRYDSVSERLHCVSCLPTKTPASGGGSTLQSLYPEDVIAPLSSSAFVQNLRADGKRVFFQSTEALVSRDNDGVQDVYEWEEDEVGSCTQVGGCVYLISSGHSGKPNYLYGISASGDDVFFTTADVLVGGDNDTLSIYDARVNGGFAEAPCQSGECPNEKPPTPAPFFPAPESEGASAPPTPSKHCPKGKHKVTHNGKQACVKNHHHKKHHTKKGRAGK